MSVWTKLAASIISNAGSVSAEGECQPRAREFGLEPPRGMLLLGVQGCGKSLCAKLVAADWNLPLLRMDPGVLYQKYVGESEDRLRASLTQAERMAPCRLVDRRD